MSRQTFNEFVGTLVANAKATGKILDFSKVSSHFFPQYFYSGSWNKPSSFAVEMTGTYKPKGTVPFSKTSLYSPTRVVRLVEFLHDIQYAAINGARIKKILNPTSKVKPFFSQLNAILDTTPVAVTGFSIKNASVIGDIGDKQQLEWEIKPADATNKKVTFAVEDPIIARVDENGLVTLLAVGQTRVSGTIDRNSSSIGVVVNK